MRIPHVLAFIGAATLSLSACAEPTIAAVPAADANTVLVQASATPYKPTPAEVQDIKGAFKLDDGRLMTVSNKRNKLFVELDGKREELVPLGENRFVTRDSGTVVAFNQLPFAHEVVLTPALQVRPDSMTAGR